MTKNFDKDCTLDMPEIQCGPPVGDKTIKGAVRNIRSKSPPREILVEMPPKITVRITDGTVRATAGKTEMKLDQPDG